MCVILNCNTIVETSVTSVGVFQSCVINNDWKWW